MFTSCGKPYWNIVQEKFYGVLKSVDTQDDWWIARVVTISGHIFRHELTECVAQFKTKIEAQNWLIKKLQSLGMWRCLIREDKP